MWNFVAFNRESGVGNQDSGHKNGRIQFESFEKIIEDYFQTRLSGIGSFRACPCWKHCLQKTVFQNYSLPFPPNFEFC